jgi:hypothetical protein
VGEDFIMNKDATPLKMGICLLIVALIWAPDGEAEEAITTMAVEGLEFSMPQGRIWETVGVDGEGLFSFVLLCAHDCWSHQHSLMGWLLGYVEGMAPNVGWKGKKRKGCLKITVALRSLY